MPPVPPIQPPRRVHAWLRGALLAASAALSLGSDCGGHPFYPGEPGSLGRCYLRTRASLATGGAQTALHVLHCSGSAPWVSAASNDPAVLAVVASGPDDIMVRSGAAGSTELALLDDAGGLVEVFTISVRRPTAIRLSTLPSRLLMAGSLARECASAYAGTEQLVVGGVLRPSFIGSLGGAPVAPPIDIDCHDDFHQAVWFGGGAGTGAVVVTAPDGASARSDWQVGLPSDVAAIHLDMSEYPPDSRANVSAQAFDRSGALFTGPVCAWSSREPGAILMPRDHDSAYALTSDWVNVRFPGQGTVGVACTIGPASATATVTFPLK